MWLVDNWHIILFWCIFDRLFPNVFRYFDPYFIALYNWTSDKVERFLQKDLLCEVCNKTEDECDHEAEGIIDNEMNN
ncbi:hypothetical protein CRE_29051 [Caenorhabditis remanei]|uniref:Uncharacterized protein n=1 Tax=Caenorhabditis remanei TaxID=31234 RepID=E3MW92_CAERE|nr:hypothetical protein CRE_29051 [Caenorhabditis remanei]